MLKHKIRILFFRKTSHVYLKLSKYGMVNQFKPIYKIFKRGEGGSTKKKIIGLGAYIGQYA